MGDRLSKARSSSGVMTVNGTVGRMAPAESSATTWNRTVPLEERVKLRRQVLRERIGQAEPSLFHEPENRRSCIGLGIARDPERLIGPERPVAAGVRPARTDRPVCRSGLT